MSTKLSDFAPYEYTVDEMLCPECNTMLVKGENKKYETLCDHVCNPNDDNLPLRVTYVCPNKDCILGREDIFWDKIGDFYGNFKISNNYWRNNNVDIFDKRTWKRKGTEAINSFSWASIQHEIKQSRKWKNIIKKWLNRKIFTPLGNRGIKLRTSHNPEYAQYRDKQSLFKFMIGQWFCTLNPFNTHYKRYMGESKKYPFGKKDYFLLRGNWSYHPYPWIRIPVRRFLKKNNEWFTDLEEKRKTRWA